MAQERGLTAIEHLRRSELVELLARSGTTLNGKQGVQLDAPLPNATKNAASRQAARQVVPKRLPPPQPLRLEQRVVLMVRDVESFYAYWDLPAQEQIGGLELALHSESATVCYFPIQPWARSYYLPVFRPGERHFLVLGVRGPKGFVPRLFSNEVTAPRAAPSGTAQPLAGAATPAVPAARPDQAPRGERGPANDPPPTPGDSAAPGLIPEVFFAPLPPNMARAAGAAPLPAPEFSLQQQRPPSGTERLPELGTRQLEGPAEATLITLPAFFGARAAAEGGSGGRPMDVAGAGPLYAWVPANALPPRTFEASARCCTSFGSASGQSAFAPSERTAPLPSTSALPASAAPARATPPHGRRGGLALVLHAHLPFVHHPEHERMLEEDWFFEALTETYLPLYALLERLAEQGCPYRLTLALSPTLLSMLSNELLLARYERHLGWLHALIQSELHRTRDSAEANQRVRYYAARIAAVRETWQRVGRGLAGAFAALAERGYLDLLTCAATHGLLPLMQQPRSIAAQLALAVATHREHCGSAPKGIWLPECAYRPGLETQLAAADLRYFVVDTHALEHAPLAPPRAWFEPVACKEAAVFAFGRDPSASEQVWSRETGYPGDPHYRDFYRDIGFDLPRPLLAPLIDADTPRKATGLKYHRIGKLDGDEGSYDPEQAASRVAEHAAHFVEQQRRQLVERYRLGDPAPLVVAPYDAELFGHWWHEGVEWLEAVLRAAADQRDFELTHLGGYLERYPDHPAIELAPSTWGEGGHHRHWLSDENAWIYPELHKAEALMGQLAGRFEAPGGLERRALNQAARELLLAQSSDWAFMMRAKTTESYARGRTMTHLERFFQLEQMLRETALDEAMIAQFEALDPIFGELDYRLYTPRAGG